MGSLGQEDFVSGGGFWCLAGDAGTVQATEEIKALPALPADTCTEGSHSLLDR